MATKLKMTDKVELTLEDLRNIFLAGEHFEADATNCDIGEVENVTEPDFGEYMEKSFGIEINDDDIDV